MLAHMRSSKRGKYQGNAPGEQGPKLPSVANPRGKGGYQGKLSFRCKKENPPHIHKMCTKLDCPCICHTQEDK